MLVILSFVVILTWLVAELRTLTVRKFKSSDDFCLTQGELGILAGLKREEQAVSGNLSQALNKVASLESMGHGVRRNKNGDFDGRSRLGKKLNKELPRARALAFKYRNQFNEIKQRVSEFDELPADRAKSWKEVEAFRLANRATLIAFTVILILYAVSGYSIAFFWIIATLLWIILLWVAYQVQQGMLDAQLKK